ncbi:MAG: RHS repeat protein [Acidobacteriota bacterium]|nr:RHS repeat protein [Acidobacteriota bacterium]
MPTTLQSGEKNRSTPFTFGAIRLEERIEYDTVGNVKKRIDTANRETVYDYDTANRLIKTTDALNQIIQFEYNPRSRGRNKRSTQSGI